MKKYSVLLLIPVLLIAFMVSCKNPVSNPTNATATVTETSTAVIVANTATLTRTSTRTSTQTSTRTSTQTSTPVIVNTATATKTASDTATVTATASATATPKGTAIVVPLGSASTFGAYGYAGVTNVDDGTTLTDVTGDLGSYGALSTITGFPAVQVHGTIWGMDSVNSIVTTVFNNATTAYTYLAGLPVTATDPGAELGTKILPPGTYETSSGAFSIIAGNLTLDSTDPNAVWVFKMATTLTVGDSTAARSVILLHQAQAKNVYWQVGSAADINISGLGGTMVGTIIANAAIRFSVSGSTTKTVLNGRALSLGAAVTMITSNITVPQ